MHMKPGNNSCEQKFRSSGSKNAHGKQINVALKNINSTGPKKSAPRRGANQETGSDVQEGISDFHEKETQINECPRTKSKAFSLKGPALPKRQAERRKGESRGERKEKERKERAAPGEGGSIEQHQQAEAGRSLAVRYSIRQSWAGGQMQAVSGSSSSDQRSTRHSAEKQRI